MPFVTSSQSRKIYRTRSNKSGAVGAHVPPPKLRIHLPPTALAPVPQKRRGDKKKKHMTKRRQCGSANVDHKLSSKHVKPRPSKNGVSFVLSCSFPHDGPQTRESCQSRNHPHCHLPGLSFILRTTENKQQNHTHQTPPIIRAPVPSPPVRTDFPQTTTPPKPPKREVGQEPYQEPYKHSKPCSNVSSTINNPYRSMTSFYWSWSYQTLFDLVLPGQSGLGM